MNRKGSLPVAILMIGASLPLPVRAAQIRAPQTPALRIVVVEGEDAVNIVQQKTAVAPVVEVRDRNDQPVAGVLVRFAIQGGRASFNERERNDGWHQFFPMVTSI